MIYIVKLRNEIPVSGHWDDMVTELPGGEEKRSIIALKSCTTIAFAINPSYGLENR